MIGELSLAMKNFNLGVWGNIKDWGKRCFFRYKIKLLYYIILYYIILM
ncbi:MAG: hypothetical protein BTN85_0183 [Candidatus Methanohalarchaeum thermophilum]|uniref:Uncharacterized protein n=1 Tax=Methanohalarchaeum thermophilum TaxID=1903181 RepID=A0A1Q6DTN8_METT1|nr:MAG: hypothetical protein BTN85_0183 [Candidatus Methanohalarchaeum thermophilum]